MTKRAVAAAAGSRAAVWQSKARAFSASSHRVYCPAETIEGGGAKMALWAATDSQ
ncbi:hypothetical protein FH972_025517 [Carpinus fangiana]|uniref:Uncharacterized protein n=1 Tax=Carpinus fangiana TaxID=176857 RepID=A0A5N6L194_9ROSI|nr:hypothetical protein FH972_025517 [Carpinus fangiana]